jgi:hypothetical protein
MKTFCCALVPVIVATALVAGCGGTPATTAASNPPADGAGSTAGSEAGAQSGAAAGATAGTVTGVVAETMNSGGYTYARLTRDGVDTWMAAPEILSIKVGDTLVGDVDMPMDNFRSRTLNREFDRIYFVRRVTRDGQVLPPAPAADSELAMMASRDGLAPPPAAPAPAPQVTTPIDPAPGGVRVAELWAKRAALSGKPIVVRGQVVKANYEIMGVNWYHLQDGSGTASDGTNDLTVTSDAQVKVGDIVTVSGMLTTGKDFGSGYAFDAIVEKAEIKK